MINSKSFLSNRNHHLYLLQSLSVLLKIEMNYLKNLKVFFNNSINNNLNNNYNSMDNTHLGNEENHVNKNIKYFNIEDNDENNDNNSNSNCNLINKGFSFF